MDLRRDFTGRKRAGNRCHLRRVLLPLRHLASRSTSASEAHDVCSLATRSACLYVDSPDDDHRMKALRLTRPGAGGMALVIFCRSVPPTRLPPALLGKRGKQRAIESKSSLSCPSLGLTTSISPPPPHRHLQHTQPWLPAHPSLDWRAPSRGPVHPPLPKTSAPSLSRSVVMRSKLPPSRG
jgi:hypothetical protein